MAHIKVTIELYAEGQRPDNVTVVTFLQGETARILNVAVEQARRQAEAASTANPKFLDELGPSLDPGPNEA